MPGELKTTAPDFAETKTGPLSSGHEFPEEAQPELSGTDFDGFAAEPGADFPAETPGDNSGVADGGGSPAYGSGETAFAADTDDTAEETTHTDTVNTGAAATAAAGAADTNTNTANTDAALTETAAAETPSAKTGKSASTPSIQEDHAVLVKQLDQYFPAFRILEELDIGRYNLVFQVMGEKEILYKTYKPIYFIGDAEFTLGEIQSFLPVETTGGRLIPPGINVMLEIEIKTDPRLDPYVIWHSGKNILAQGRLSGGANYLLWETPEQTGFHNIRAEVFPLLPEDRMPGNMLGKIKELSLPVSLKSEGIKHFSDPSGEFISWYQFGGTLDDAKAPNNSERSLVSLYAKAPRWIPFGGIYGLLVGQDDIYTLPGTPFTLSENEQGTGRLLLHLAALSEGALASIRFSGGETADTGTAELDLSFAGDTLILRIASEGAFREQSFNLDGDEMNGFIAVVVEFTIAPDRLNAELRLENSGKTTGPLSAALAAPISGAGAVRCGGAEYPGHKRSATQPALDKDGKYGAGTMALNELALSYTRLPVPQREEESLSGIPENSVAEETYPGAEPEPSSSNAL
jgi:hypothetical protein